MVDCLKTNDLWLNICNWIKNKLGIELKLGNVEKYWDITYMTEISHP